MSRYRLRDDLSYCRIGKQFVFLDIGDDRYFCLPPSMEQTFGTYIEEIENPGLDVTELVVGNILVESTAITAPARSIIKSAERSAMEMPLPAQAFRLRDLFETFVTVLITKLQLTLSPLRSLLSDLASDRYNRYAQADLPSTLHELRLIDAAATFRRARLYVPVNMRCLLDSIAMVKFLHKRQLPAHIVFAVAIDPFSAHCWVQAGDLILNDSLGNVNAHTPIRIV